MCVCVNVCMCACVCIDSGRGQRNGKADPAVNTGRARWQRLVCSLLGWSWTRRFDAVCVCVCVCVFVRVMDAHV